MGTNVRLTNDINLHRESTHSGTSSLSNKVPTKRAREDDEMDISSNGKREPTVLEEPVTSDIQHRSPNTMNDTTPMPPETQTETGTAEEDAETRSKGEEDPNEMYKFIQTPAHLMQTPAQYPFAQEQAQAVFSPPDLAGVDIGEDFNLEEIPEEDLEKDGS